jgi:type VI protein secretion system component Hcp
MVLHITSRPPVAAILTRGKTMAAKKKASKKLTKGKKLERTKPLLTITKHVDKSSPKLFLS